MPRWFQLTIGSQDDIIVHPVEVWGNSRAFFFFSLVISATQYIFEVIKNSHGIVRLSANKRGKFDEADLGFWINNNHLL